MSMPAAAQLSIGSPASTWEIPLLCEITAIDDQLRAGHEACFIAGKEQHAVSNLDRLARSLHRCAFNDVFGSTSRDRRTHFGGNEPGMNGIDADTFPNIA